MQAIESWQTAWRQGDTQGLSKLYDAALSEAPLLDKQRSRLASLGPLSKLSVDDMSIYNWQEDAGEIRIVNLHMAKDSSSTIRQYWRKHDGDWKIFSEDVLS